MYESTKRKNEKTQLILKDYDSLEQSLRELNKLRFYNKEFQ